ncbi:MAG: glutamate--tRNA ligase [Gemmatimonadota bacterium]|nr:MAG: glutamate--tRNA ligase [Gemmatimonadota bacterium]
MSIRVRFPPSPTGYLHVGGARTALFNWLFARKHGGVFVLRIEDTDRERSKPEHTATILHALKWLGLDWDEGPFFQNDGVDRHRGEARDLLAADKAFRDFMTPEELTAEQAKRRPEGGLVDRRLARKIADAMAPGEAERRAAAGEPYAIRFRVPDGETTWSDMVHGEMRFENADIDDLVILRSDGSPTYNLAVVSDDADERITHVIRGDDHLSNTPKQILLYEALGQPVPLFGHVPMILGADGKRLSKRHGATSVGEYERQGLLSAAMVNFLALLGWSPGDDREQMTVDELVEAFSMERVLKKSSIFDLEKLAWLSGQHFNDMEAAALAPGLTERLVEAGLAHAADLEARQDWYFDLIDLLKSRCRTMNDLVDQAMPFVTENLEIAPDAVEKHWLNDPEGVGIRLQELANRLEACPWNEAALEAVFRGYAEEMGMGAGKVIHPVRVAITGRTASPGIFHVLRLMGKDRVVQRLGSAVARLSRMTKTLS